jgi:hypothetical protein
VFTPTPSYRGGVWQSRGQRAFRHWLPQTRKPIVHLAQHPADPHAAERLELIRGTGCYVIQVLRSEWRLYGENYNLPEGRKVVSRMDDDDCLCREFCELTFAAAPSFGEVALLWPNGIVYYRSGAYGWSHRGNQFVSIVTDGMKSPHDQKHHLFADTWLYRVVSEQPGWIWIRHGDAVTPTISKYRRKRLPRIPSERIPINLRAVDRAIAESGPSAAGLRDTSQQTRCRHVDAVAGVVARGIGQNHRAQLRCVL